MTEKRQLLGKDEAKKKGEAIKPRKLKVYAVRSGNGGKEGQIKPSSTAAEA